MCASKIEIAHLRNWVSWGTWEELPEAERGCSCTRRRFQWRATVAHTRTTRPCLHPEISLCKSMNKYVNNKVSPWLRQQRDIQIKRAKVEKLIERFLWKIQKRWNNLHDVPYIVNCTCRSHTFMFSAYSTFVNSRGICLEKINRVIAIEMEITP